MFFHHIMTVSFKILIIGLSLVEERWKEWQTNKNPEVLLSFCMRLLFCMHPQFPQVWTAPHSHAAVAPGLWSYCARGFWGYAEYGMSSTLVYCLHANDEWNHPNIFQSHCLIHKTSNLQIQVDYFSYLMLCMLLLSILRCEGNKALVWK